jgi:hypothetical protein
MESIVRHYPIGTLTLLKEKRNPSLGAEPLLDEHDGDFKPHSRPRLRIKDTMLTNFIFREAGEPWVHLQTLFCDYKWMEWGDECHLG